MLNPTSVFLVVDKCSLNHVPEIKQQFTKRGINLQIHSSLTNALAEMLINKPDVLLVSDNDWMQLGSSSKQISFNIRQSGCRLIHLSSYSEFDPITQFDKEFTELARIPIS